MGKKTFLFIVAFLFFAICMTMVVLKMQEGEKGDHALPATDIQQPLQPQPRKTSADDKKREAMLRQLFFEAEEWVTNVEERRIEAESGDQRMGYGAAVDAAEDALCKLETYKSKMTPAQLEKLMELRERLEE